MIEVWRSVTRDPRYEVSTSGLIRSLHRNRLLKTRPLPSGYQRVSLGRQGLDTYVHVVVLETFIGPRPTKDHQASHLDGNPTNNKLANLAWELPSQNNMRKHAHGTAMVGIKNGMGKKTHCKRGHEFTEKNTRRANGKRICRTCARDHMRRRRALWRKSKTR